MQLGDLPEPQVIMVQQEGMVTKAHIAAKVGRIVLSGIAI